ncbi:HEAT repeat domain-containing protein [Thalassoglobus polymorphus]|uniref:HEAT repeat protein n=1 Tax=Thalassoglobus polymorphus TaxID=2527994 RepID=A0A517QMF8_9PLAN|nr:HEAT repeat domain-containing protein [Thalassoglobus polymorphus]QDT32785.1 HEAT repeat protein [Thalassoglobus polymorphus]
MGKRKRRRKKSNQKKKSSSAGVSIGLIAGGVCAVVFVIGVGIFVWQNNPSGSQGDLPKRKISREQIEFASDSDLGQSRTTAEWLALLKEMRTTENMMRATFLKARMPNPEAFLGADPAAVPDVYEALKDPRLEKYGQAIIAKFGQSADPPYFQDVMDGLNSDHPQVRRAAIQLLAHVKPEGPDTAEQVGKYLNDADPEVSKSATIALGSMGEPGFELLVTQLKGNQSPSPHLLKAMALFGESAAPAVPDLAKLLTVESTEHRVPVLIALEKIGSSSKVALPELIEVWSTESGEKWSEQVTAVMNRIGKPATTAMLEKFAQVPAEAQIIATQHFINQKSHDAIPVLIQSLEAPKSVEAREVALDALRGMLPENSPTDEQLAALFEFGDTELRAWTLEEIAASTERCLKYKSLLTQVRSGLQTSLADPRVEKSKDEYEAGTRLVKRIDQVVESL